jgi:hypothetical protein
MFIVDEPAAQSVQRFGYWLDNPTFDSRHCQEVCLFSKTSVHSLGPKQPLFEEIPGPLSRGIKWPGHIVDLVPRLRMGGAVPLLPTHVNMECVNCVARTETLKLCVLHHLISRRFAATD